MSDHHKGALAAPEGNSEHIRQAWEYAALKAMKAHRQSGEPVTTWDRETGQIVMMSPDAFPLPDDLVTSDQTSTDTKAR